MSRNAEDCENSGSLPQLESEPAVEQIGETPEDVSFAIPEKWKWVQLNNVTTQITDGTHHSPVSFSKEDPRGKFLYITAKNIKFTGVDCSTATYVTEDTHKEITSRCLPEYRDVLYIKDGATTGVVTVNNIEEPFSLLSSVALIKPIKLMLDPDFLSFTLRSKSMTDLVRGKMKGTGIPRVTLKILKKFSIPLPPLEEQRRIVAKLNELLPLVEIYGKEQEALEKMEKEFPDKLRASLLQEAIQGKLVPQLESEPEVEQIGNAPEEVPFEIPKKWKWVQLKTIFAKRSTINPVDYGESKVELWSIPAFDKGKPEVVPARLIGSSKKVVVEGDVLLSKIVPHIKRAWVVSETNGNKKLASTEWIVFHSNDFFPNFLTMALTEPHFHSSLMSTISGMGSLKRANPQKVGELYIPCPSLAEQHRIVARLNKLLASINQLGD